MTIMRLWHVEVAIEKADEYEKFMIEKAAPDYGQCMMSFTRSDITIGQA